MRSIRSGNSAIPRTLFWQLALGVAGTLIFPLAYIVNGAVRPGYNPWAETISTLSHLSNAWVQEVNFVLCGLFILWMAYVWRKILTGGVCATWYPILRVIEGLGLVAVAIFTEDPWHTVAQIIIVQAMAVGLFVIARRFWRQPQWRGWVIFTVACGLIPFVVMPMFGIALNSHGPLAPYAGLFERVGTNADTVWSVALVVRLWRNRSLHM